MKPTTFYWSSGNGFSLLLFTFLEAKWLPMSACTGHFRGTCSGVFSFCERTFVHVQGLWLKKKKNLSLTATNWNPSGSDALIWRAAVAYILVSSNLGRASLAVSPMLTALRAKFRPQRRLPEIWPANSHDAVAKIINTKCNCISVSLFLPHSNTLDS